MHLLYAKSDQKDLIQKINLHRQSLSINPKKLWFVYIYIYIVNVIFFTLSTSLQIAMVLKMINLLSIILKVVSEVIISTKHMFVKSVRMHKNNRWLDNHKSLYRTNYHYSSHVYHFLWIEIELGFLWFITHIHSVHQPVVLDFGDHPYHVLWWVVGIKQL